MFNKIIQTPFIRLLFALSAGIVFGHKINIPITISCSLLVLTYGSVIGLTSVTRIFENFRFRWVFGIFINIFLFAFGILISGQQVNKLKNNLLLNNKSVEIISNTSETPGFEEHKLIKLFYYSGLTNNEINLASTLIFGNSSCLDKTAKGSFSSSGLINFLAVSGLSVGFIYAILIYFPFFTVYVKYSKFLKALIVLSGIWIFSFISGFSEPVVRVTVILSIIIAGKLTNRPFNIIHSLAFSVFLLLFLNPGILFDIGFQLSVMSILSVVFFYPYILNLLHINNIIIEKIWKLFAVSIAVQIGTFPLIIYYFHEFQNLFLLSNILIIPLTAIIYFLATGMAFASGCYWAGYILGKIFHFFVWVLMNIDSFIENIPFAISHEIYYSGLTVFFLYLIICFGFLYLMRKRAYYLTLLLGIIFLMSTEKLINILLH